MLKGIFFDISKAFDKVFPLFIRRDLGTTLFACQDKNFLITIVVVKTYQNIQESRDK